MTPVVLHHGLFGGDYGGKSTASFKGIDQAISSRGYPLSVSAVHPTASIATRARQLKSWILTHRAKLGPERLVLIAHSMGGLDARYMLSKLDMAEHVSALVTVTTPHRGSPFADWCVRNIGKRLGAFKLLDKLGLDIQAVEDLTTERCARFNEEILDVPDVQYYSVTAARPWHKVPPFAFHMYGVVFKAEGPNDSLVSVKSATWGQHLGTWPADHWHTINRRYVPEFRNPTGNIAPYYLDVLQRVASISAARSAA